MRDSDHEESTMKTAITSGILTLAGAVGFGALAMGTGQTAASGSDEMILNKREDTAVQWVVADDDADDDTNTGSRTDGPSHDNTNSASHDGTNSRFTAVSRDRDRSRGDLTRDWTRDGGDRTKDKSRNHTNDRSRNDTRRKWR
jgi:hypothetical protein